MADFDTLLLKIVTDSWQSRIGSTMEEYYENVRKDINFTNRDGKTLLQFANCSPADLKVLLTHGADVNHVCGRGYTPLIDAIYLQRSEEYLKVLLDAGAKLSQGDAPALAHAALVAKPEILVFLLNSGADVDELCKLERTPLFYALMGTYPASKLDILLSFGADPNVVDFYGNTPYTFGLVENPDGTYSYDKKQ